MDADISYRTVEDLCDTVQRLTETVKAQEAENAQLRALLRELRASERAAPTQDIINATEDEERAFSGILEED